MTGDLIDILDMKVMVVGDNGGKLYSLWNGSTHEHLWGSKEVTMAQAIWNTLSPEDLPRYASLTGHLWGPDQTRSSNSPHVYIWRKK